MTLKTPRPMRTALNHMRAAAENAAHARSWLARIPPPPAQGRDICRDARFMVERLVGAWELCRRNAILRVNGLRERGRREFPTLLDVPEFTPLITATRGDFREPVIVRRGYDPYDTDWNAVQHAINLATGCAATHAKDDI